MSESPIQRAIDKYRRTMDAVARGDYRRYELKVEHHAYGMGTVRQFDNCKQSPVHEKGHCTCFSSVSEREYAERNPKVIVAKEAPEDRNYMPKTPAPKKNARKEAVADMKKDKPQ